MSPPSQWGPPTWRFMHTLAHKIKEEQFVALRSKLVSFIVNICHTLPCPDCAQHAREFWKSISPSATESKHKLMNVLYVFHNRVNGRRKMPLFRYEDLRRYGEILFIPCYNNFAKNFVVRGVPPQLLAESFRRSLLMRDLRRWLSDNILAFDLTAQMPPAALLPALLAGSSSSSSSSTEEEKEEKAEEEKS